MTLSSESAVETKSASADGTRTLTRLYIAALAAVAMLSIGGQLVVQTRLAEQSADATIVNVAGRQRMISQRLAKCALAAAASTADERAARAAEFREWLPLWRRCHQALQRGDAELEVPHVDDPQAAAMFREIDPSFQAMDRGASELLAGLEANRPVSRSAVDSVLAREGEFLRGMDRIVSHFEDEAQKRVARLRRVETFLLVLLLTVLVAEGALVFRPATRRIRQSFAAQRLAHEALCRAHEELRLAKNAAEAASRAKTRFLANVSHELRTPLHAVLGGVELLEERPLDERSREYVDMIGDAARAQLGLVNDLLDLSMIEAEKAELRPRAFRLRSMFERTCGMLRPMASARGLTLHCRMEPGVPVVVVGDELRLRQVLLNLISNAIKFTDAGTIDCRVRADLPTSPAAAGEPARIRFEVADTGIGIAESDRRHIFDRFTQVDDSSERRRGGAGLGLAICAEWVERMGGRIEVESRPGEGSRFGFELPLPVGPPDLPPDSVPDPDLKKSSTASDRPERRLRILLADDAPAGRLIVAELLGQAGHEVLAVADGRAAVAAAAQSTFDAALIDVQMPELDGPGAVAAIRRQEQAQNRPRLPIAALTADALPLDSRRLEEAGFDTKLTKPISAPALLAAIDELVAAAGNSPAPPLAPLFAPSPRYSGVRGECGEEPRGRGPFHSAPEPGTLGGSKTAPQSALNRLQGNEKLLAELSEMFAAEGTDAIDRLKAALSVADCRSVFQVAHRLKGQLLLLGADEAAEVAAAIELAGHEGRPAAAAERLHDLAAAVESVSHLSLRRG